MRREEANAAGRREERGERRVETEMRLRRLKEGITEFFEAAAGSREKGTQSGL
mgnify:CR=1 FL=1